MKQKHWIRQAAPWLLLRTFWGNTVVALVALVALLVIVGLRTKSPPVNWLASVSCAFLPCLSSVEIKDNDCVMEIKFGKQSSEAESNKQQSDENNANEAEDQSSEAESGKQQTDENDPDCPEPNKQQTIGDKEQRSWSELVELSVRDNKNLKKVSLTCLRNLRTLIIVRNPELSDIQLSGLPNLRRLLIKGNGQLTEIPAIDEIGGNGCAERPLKKTAIRSKERQQRGNLPKPRKIPRKLQT